MTNLEKYLNDINKEKIRWDGGSTCGVCDLHYFVETRGMVKKCVDIVNCTNCLEESLLWLAQEYKEPILDEVEREYLSDFIKPFRETVKDISKWASEDGYEWLAVSYVYKNFAMATNLPPFDEKTMYKGMELNKDYTLKDLGL